MTERLINEESKARKADNEFFPTPGWVVDAILPHLDLTTRDGSPCRVLDPCIGEGAILDRVLARTWDFQQPYAYMGIEIDPVRAQVAWQRFPGTVVADALTIDWPAHDVAIFNPPFSLAEDFARKALEARPPQGTVAMIARLAFLESVERYDFHREYPMDVHVLPKRPGFLSGSGKTDMSAYAWFVAGPGRGNRWFVLEPPAEALAKARAKRAKIGGGA